MKPLKFLYCLMLALSAIASPLPVAAQTAFPNAVFLLNYGQYGAHPPSDYRPSVDPSGTRVVYERTYFNSQQGYLEQNTYLHVSELRFQLGPNNGLGESRLLYNAPAYRADWCPQGTANSDGLIAFSTDAGIFVVDPDQPAPPRLVKNSMGLYYPAWYPFCSALAVKQVAGVDGGPSALAIDPRNGVVLRRLSGNATWAGFVSVDAAAPRLIVFAGQPVGAAKYDENMNYVYLADQSKYPPRVFLLDPRAPRNGPFDPHFQGRAPTFSPDGFWVAFESNRPPCNGSQTNYALFIQRTDGRAPARQVTDCSYNAQHARWIPPIPGTGRTILIAAAWQPGISPPAFGVAAFDISAFLQR